MPLTPQSNTLQTVCFSMRVKAPSDFRLLTARSQRYSRHPFTAVLTEAGAGKKEKKRCISVQRFLLFLSYAGLFVKIKNEKNKLCLLSKTELILAEKERFELSNRFWRLHDFQSCALDQLRDFSVVLIGVLAEYLYIIPQRNRFVNRFFKKSMIFFEKFFIRDRSRKDDRILWYIPCAR